MSSLRTLRLYCVLCAACWVLTVVVSGLATYPADPGFDFFDYLVRFPYLHTRTFFTYPTYPWYYPAPAILVSYPFYKLAMLTDAQTGYNVFLFVGVLLYLGAIGWLWQRVPAGSQGRKWIMPAALLSCYPISFALQRGNIEALTWTLIALAVLSLASQQTARGATLVGVAGSIKIYPLLFAALFFRTKPFRSLGLIAVTFVVFTAIGLYVLWPHRATAGLVLHGIQQWTRDYSLPKRDAAWDHSLFGLVKELSRRSALTERWLDAYYLTAGSGALACYLLRARKLDLLGQVSFFCIAAVLLPPTSFDYTLCLLYVPLGMLFYGASGERLTVRQRHLLLGYALAVSPQFWVTTRTHITGLPGSVRALTLLAVLVLTLRLDDSRDPHQISEASPRPLHA